MNLPKPGGTIQTVYGGNFTTATGKVWTTGNGGQIASLKAFAAITSNGSVVAWGDSLRGGSLGTAAGSLTSNVTAITSNSYAFAALKNNGSVVTWGPADSGGNSTSVAPGLTSNVRAVFSTSMAFAALKNDGSVVTWGDQAKGGNSTAVAASLTSNVTAIFSTGTAFAALKNDGSVVTWGDADAGGNSTAVAGNLASNVVAIYSHSNAFAALKGNGSLVTWGAANTGGDQGAVAGNLTSNVTGVFTNAGAFAALKSNGSVVTWGFSSYIANSNAVASSLSSNVTNVFSTYSAFAALKNDGSIVTWGEQANGGNSTAVAGSLSSNVTKVFSTFYAFAALKNDGSVVTWGDQANGGNSTAVAGSLGSNVTSIHSTAGAFAALKNDGSVVVWGNPTFGGNSSTVAASLTSNVTAIYSNQNAFAALKKDGSVVTWGDSTAGGTGGPANIGAAGTLPATLFARIGSSPGQAGPVSGNITLTSPGAPSQAISLGGTVLSPAAISLSGNLSFGQILVGQNATRDFSISNLSSSGSALTVSSIASSNSSFSILGNTSNLTVSPSASQNVTVRFQPGVSGDFSANITVTSNAGNNSLLATGTGVHTRIIGLSGNLSFGSATVNSTGNRTLSVSNTGTGSLTVTSISYPQGFSGNFSGIIDPGATQNVTVSFRPPSAGSFGGNITVNSNATSGTMAIAASGTGVDSRIIGLSGNLSFGNATLNSTATRQLSISNTGTGNLTITGINYPPGFSGNFSATIAPGATQNVTVDFRPSSEGGFGGNITVNSDSTSGTSTIAASGNGVQSRIIGLSGNLSFGNATVNSTSNRTLTIANTGTGNLAITGINYPQGFSGNFSGTVAPGATQNVTVAFRPSSEGAFGGNITVNSDSTSGTSTIAASGNGVHTRIIGLSGNLSFGNATVNSTTNGTLSIANTGTGSLTLTGINYPPGFSGNFSGTIAPGATQNVTVAFRPASEGVFGGNITVNSDSTSGTSTIAASGSGVHSRIIGLSGNLSFGNATVNSTSNRTLSIANTGTGNLNITGINYPQGFSGNFSGTVAPGATQNVTVAFRPSGAGAFGGNITVNSDSTSGTSTIAASGTGVLVAVPVITSPASANGTVGTPFSYQITAGNNPTSFSINGTLPTGLTLNSTSGLISGTPLAAGAGTANVTLVAGNSGGNGTASLAITISHTRTIGLSGNLSFGNATVNSTSNRTLSITNTGSGNLTVASISYPQGFSGNFSGVIAPGATQNVTVSFRPASEGAFGGNITVNSDSTSGTSTIAASGSGVHTRIIGLSGNLSFGNATVNSASNRTLAISNTGTGNLTLTGINYPPGFSGNFSGTVAAGATQNVTVSFRPASGGSFGGNITVDSNATSGTSTIAASGTGLSALSLTGDLSFGNVTVNQTANRTVSIINNSPGPVTVSVSSLPAWLKDNPAGNFTLNANASRTVAYTFLPVAEQAYSANITFSSSQGNATLAATGAGAHIRSIQLNGDLGFGPTLVGTSLTRNFTITNNGTASILVSAISYPAGYTGNSSGNFTLAPGAVRGVSVTFQPTEAKSFSGNVTVSSNATAGPASLGAVGVGSPAMEVTWGSGLLFGNVTVNQTANGTIFIRNNSANSANFSLPNLPHWLTADTTGSFPVAGNSTRNVTITFRPPSDQAYSANFTVASSLGNATVPAMGQGIHTRVVRLSGNLSFGNVAVNTTANRTLTIENAGSSNLTVTGISMPYYLSGNWTGTIAPGATRNVTISFRPGSRGPLGGNLTVLCNFTSGSAEIPVSGRAVTTPIITPGVEKFEDFVDGIRVGAYFEYYIDTHFDDADSYGADPAFYNGSTMNPGLPEGLSLNATTGLISGYPRYPLPLTSNITATNAAGTGRGQLVFKILPGAVTLFGENKSRSLDFGSVTIGSTITRNITVENLTNDPITVSRVSSSSPGFTGNLSINPLTISKKASRLVRVRFTPALAGAHNATISVGTSLGNFTIPAAGTGVGGIEIKLTGNSSFGSATAGTLVTSNLTVRNPSEFPLTVSGITYPPGFSGNWSGGTIQPYTSRNVTVTFAPTAAQAYGGNITVNSDATVGNPTFPVSGTGTPSRVIGLSGNLSFGGVGVNAQEFLFLAIRNSGSADLAVSNITYPAGFEGMIPQPGNPITIASNGSWNLPVFFKPTATQGYGGNITLTTDATSGNSIFPVSGTGISSAVVSLTGNLSFDAVLVNSTLTRNLTITNTGIANLTVTGLAYPAGFSGNASGNFTLAPNGSRNVAVTFRPTAAGNFTGNISVNSNTKFGTTSLAASGMGVPAITLKVYSTMFDGSLYEENSMGFIGASDRFGRIGVNQTANLTLSFKNHSPAPVTVTIPTLPSWLTLNATSSFTVAANDIRNLTATFRPPDETDPKKMPGYSQNITFTPSSGTPVTVAAFGSGFHTRIIGFSGNLSFGSVAADSNPTRILTLSNTGSDTLRIGRIVFPQLFSGNSSGNITIAPNATRELAVTFRPNPPGISTALSGNFSDNIFILSNATSGNSTIRDENFVANTTIPVTASHFPIRTMSLVPMSFGKVAVSNHTSPNVVSATFSIVNTGTGSIDVYGLELPEGFAGHWSGNIAPGATATTTISFWPTAKRQYFGTITVKSNITSGPNSTTIHGEGR